ncbi:uncharacterized protein BT62DRAFT_1012440 [Guyanagaster necrorhizus]|uniref:Uncharacterized protein n=1 Tax=Guyanagaster necrorhizus TaxID=856835 RepID=A0A9P7VH85_9AGAR|nr:uncharacterized protein BT62DRAFT_1012440 [Guyanagaster necrorhizus MCA 3950]KAG7440664.1 hypothetical protein BT62DRAFT_1012440 [Guyanagaster necrorhizus MCA 3950]
MWVNVRPPYLVVTLELQIHVQDVDVSARGLEERQKDGFDSHLERYSAATFAIILWMSCNQGGGIHPLDHVLCSLLALPCPKRKHQINVIMPLGDKLHLRRALRRISPEQGANKECGTDNQ